MPVPTSLDRPVAGTSSGKNIWIAAGEGDLERVKECVDVLGISPTAADEFTYTPLHAAASYGHLDILRYLLSHPSAPADAVNTTDSDLDTPLFVCETIEAARCLIEEFHGDAKHRNADGLTAAQQAMENEHEELAQYIAGVTGESLQDDDEDAEEEQQEATVEEDENGVPRQSQSLTAEQQTEQDERLDAQTDQLMARVGEIMTRAERDGTDPEPELRTLVSESVLRQIVEGMNQPGADTSELA
ncbi:Ankyrin repeat-containing protein [Pseudozyma hubeiensis]|nr:Ankyrin repeat-containing protein [Pseudozyma hubeiensis]